MAMIIDKNIKKYIILSEESLSAALGKIEENEEQIIFVITPSGILEGVLTDGDFRRWLLRNKGNIDLDQQVKNIINRNYIFAYIFDSRSKIRAMMSPEKNKRLIPLLDEQKRRNSCRLS